MGAAGNQRVYSLDVLKFLAIVIILCHHFQQVLGLRFSTGINWYNGTFYWGYLVELFFILSGLFTYRYVARIDADSRLSDFFLKKYLRFLLLLALAGAFYLLVNFAYRHYFGLGDFPFSLWTVLSSLAGVSRWLDTSLMVNNPMWYVSVLLLCFVVFFVVVKCSKIKGWSPLVAFAAVVAFGFVMNYLSGVYQISFPFFNGSISRGLIAFFLGVLFYEPLRKLDDKLGSHLCWVSLAVIVSFCLVYVVKQDWVTKTDYSLSYVLYFVIFPAVVAFFYSSSMRKVFSAALWRNVGSTAYGMYVWHAPIIYICMMAAAAVGISIESRLGMWGFLAVCFVVGYLCQKFLEPALNGIANKALVAWRGERP